jgi:hypothetical protein
MSYVIARLSDDGQSWETLQAFKSYEAADRGLDALSDRYPYAWLEIIPAAGANGPELLLEMLEMRWWREDY